MLTLTDVYFGKNAAGAGDYCPTQEQVYYNEWVAENEQPMTQEEYDAKMEEGIAIFDKMEEFVKRHNLAALKDDWTDDPYWWNLWLTECV